jgi:hypothetical protein
VCTRDKSDENCERSQYQCKEQPVLSGEAAIAAHGRHKVSRRDVWTARRLELNAGSNRSGTTDVDALTTSLFT